MQEVGVNLTRFTELTRVGCLAWIKESKQSWTDLSALTGIPPSRLRTLNLDSSDLLALAGVLDSLRPLSFEFAEQRNIERRKATRVSHALADRTDGFKEKFPEQWERMGASVEQADRDDATFEALSRPLTEAWAGLSFVEAQADTRHLSCGRCSYGWMSRKAATPKKCPRCQSPYWNSEAAVDGE